MRIPVMKRSFCAVMLALILAASLATNVYAGVFKESWYMSRGKANMKIKNYKAAIEAFEKLVAINPDNHEAMQLLGRSYELQGLTDKAIEHWDRHLKRFPGDADIAFKQARYLEAQRFAYRKEDAIRYYRMGLNVKPDHEKRHRLAKLLAGDKGTLDQAVAEYRILIKNRPHDADLKVEYRKLLVWDDRYLREAIRAYEEAVRESPDQFSLQLQLARLYYKDSAYTQKAIRQYERLVAQQPGDVKLRREYAKALAKSDRHFYQATQQFQTVLNEQSDYQTRLLYADHLSQKTATREKALTQYKMLLQTKPNDARVRMKYARLLGARQETIDPAITQYKVLLEQNPKDAVAHRELAAAYAWQGNNDRAIYHSKLALRYEENDKAAARVKDELMQGREPRLWGGGDFLDQKGEDSNYDYTGFQVRTGGRADITPFLTGGAEVGLETFRGEDRDVDGIYYILNLQGRFDPMRRIDVQWKYHDFDAGDDGSEFLMQYTTQKEGLTITPGLRRQFKYDSLLAIAGDTDEVTRQKIGSARSNTAFCTFAGKGERMEVSTRPYLGYVSAESTDNNMLLGADADARYRISEREAFAFSTLYKLQLVHYEEDGSGFEDTGETPFAGGYFSPDLFVNNVLHLEFSFQLQSDSELHLSIGPSFQYKQEHSDEEGWHTGVDIDMTYDMKISPSIFLTAQGSYNQIADVYHRYLLTALITYTF